MSHLRRLCSVVAASTLAVTGLTILVTPPAQAATAPRAVAQGADWLSGQLTNGLMQDRQYDFTDYGLSIDTALALEEVGGHSDQVATVGRALRDRYYSYTSGADFGTDDLYAGAIAKALVLAQIADTGPATYQPHVTNDLEGRVSDSAPTVGRIEDFVDPTNQFGGDFANVIGQSFAARALTVADSGLADETRTFLLDQQCSAGFFREQFTADKGSAAQSCDAASGEPSLDTTALVAINLEAISGTPGVSSALDHARTWLKAQQNPDGSFGEPANANSTGVAAWALGNTPESADAAVWLRAHQADDADRCSGLRGDIGAVAFDDDALANGRSDGVTTAIEGQWRRASAQSLPALEFLPVAPAARLQVVGPRGYVAAGSTATYAINGANPGSRLCLSVTGSAIGGSATSGGTATLVLKMPAGTADRAVAVVDGDGATAETVSHVLGAKRLTVKPRHKTVHRRARLHVVVRGLAPGEHVTLRFRGHVVRAGTATAAGTFVRDIRVGHKLGKARIVARGEFPTIRHGRAVVRVVR